MKSNYLKFYLLIIILFLNSCAQFIRRPASLNADLILSKYKNQNPITDESDIKDLGEICGEKIRELKGLKLNNQRLSNNKIENEIITEVFSFCLSNYVRIPSVNPPGDEHLTAIYLAAIFKQLEIPYKILKLKDTPTSAVRTNIVATLSPKGVGSNLDYFTWYDWKDPINKNENPSIILLNHMDVVPAPEDKWHPEIRPFSGVILKDEEIKKIKPELADGRDYLFGRGSLDMKSIGMMQLFSMAIIKLNNIPLNKEVHFLAVADEESNGDGARAAMKEMKEGGELYSLKTAEIVLNEGGMGVINAFDGKNIHMIGTEEKGGAWMTVEASNLQDNLDSLVSMGALNFNLFQKLLQKLKLDDLNLTLNKNECFLESINTPFEKVNVLTSSIKATVACKNSIVLKKSELEEFKKALLPFEFNYKINGNKIEFSMDSASSAHGSISIGHSVLEAMVVTFLKMDLITLKSSYKKPDFYQYVESIATEGMLSELEKAKTLIKIMRLFRISIIDKLLLRQIEQGLGKDGFFRTNCQWTYLSLKNGKWESGVDCRLLHPLLSQYYSEDHAKDFIKLLNDKYRFGSSEYKLQTGWNVTTSPHNLGFQMLKDVIKDGNEKLIVAPYVFPAGSDSTYFRNPKFWGNPELKPIPAYGFFPIETTADVLTTFHGSFERFPLEQTVPGIDKMLRAVLKLSNTFYTPVYGND